MGDLYLPPVVHSAYKDHRDQRDHELWLKSLENSSTLYVGNLSFYTTEEQIYELFSKVGEIKRIIMGLDRIKKTPCGFCFVEYYTHEDAVDCMKFINGTKLDDRVIRTDLDPGFTESRQFGRGKTGGQVRDEHRVDYDPGRGGYGKVAGRAGGASTPGGAAPSSSTSSGGSALSSSSGGGDRNAKRPRHEEDDEISHKRRPT